VNYTILFNEDGTANITADCNQVQATYTVDESNINITLGPSTRAACSPESLDQVYLSSLENASIYFFEGGELFMDLPLDSGTMRFSVPGTAVPTPPVEEEEDSGVLRFSLVSFGPAGSEQPVLAGTTIAANFGDTEVNGSAGCNNYTAPLTPVDDYFTVGPIAVTAMECTEPAGVMEQEAAYLAALSGTSGYLWQQDENTLVTAGQVFYTLEDGTSGVLNFVAP
jgi:heat shock protein HslJ